MDTSASIKPLIGLTCRWDEEQKRFYLPAEYSEAVAAAGGIPVLIPLIPGAARELAGRLDAFVLTGSNSDVDPERYHQQRSPEVTRVHPQRDETDFQVLDQAFAEKKPVLGICFGMQSLNVYLGGSLVQDIPSSVANVVEHDREAHHPVQIEPGSRIGGWADGVEHIEVNSWHHQSVERAGKGLRVAGRSPDGVIEAVEGGDADHFVIAVQWHPERIWKNEPLSAKLFTELIRAATERRHHRPKYVEIAIKSNELSRAGRTDKAIALVEQGLQDVAIAADKDAVAILAKHAGVMCHYRKDYRRGVRILEQGIRAVGEKPSLLYGIGDLYALLDEPDNARAYFKRCHEACVSQDNEDYLELLEARAEYWK